MTMRYRKLDANDDMSFGRGQADFWVDVPDAPAQAIKTRLRLWTNEWFLDLSDGTPYETRVLGYFTGSTRDVAIRDRILRTPNVTGLAAPLLYSSALDRDPRKFSISAEVDTAFGAVSFQGPI